ncbi:gluconokinase [Infirmifilum lucidum]|uniref:Gluconokinase n=1 Tax=Infirmifilum lucidum TaxID=2776706 RepID=A0A7L9FHD0_9CREN|nr:gluconokinase [Infirmifilum lucidum]QOJ79179.1 gluconokinase [Infirmifilum lucidum]
MSELLLAVDIGTTNLKAALFRVEDGRIIDSFSQKIPMYTGGGIAEQDAEEIYRIYEKTVTYFAKKEQSKRIRSIFLSSQMHAFGILSREGKPTTRLLTYFDTRSKESLPLINKIRYELYRETGCPPLHVYPLAKILLARSKGWLKPRDKIMLSAKDYIILKTVGAHLLDFSTASGSQLLDIHNLKWSSLALELGGVDENQLPELLEGAEKPLNVSLEFARATGLSEDVELYAGVSDASANQLGVGATRSDTLAINLGTSAAVRFLVDKPVLDDEKMRFFLYYAGMGKYLVGGAVNNGGIVVEWYIKSLGRAEIEYSKLAGVDIYTIVDSIASKSPPGSNGLVALPFLLGGERFPIRNPEAKGLLYGLQFRHTRSDVLRALMEGVVFTLRMIYDALSEHGLRASTIKVGGNGSSLKTWRQIIADVFQVPVHRAEFVESTLLGSLIHYSTARRVQVSLNIREDITYPNEDSREVYRETYLHFRKLMELFYPIS